MSPPWSQHVERVKIKLLRPLKISDVFTQKCSASLVPSQDPQQQHLHQLPGCFHRQHLEEKCSPSGLRWLTEETAQEAPHCRTVGCNTEAFNICLPTLCKIIQMKILHRAYMTPHKLKNRSKCFWTVLAWWGWYTVVFSNGRKILDSSNGYFAEVNQCSHSSTPWFVYTWKYSGKYTVKNYTTDWKTRNPDCFNIHM